MKQIITIAVLVFASVGATLADQPSPGARADAYAQQARQNAQELRKYTWHMRVQLTLKGEAKPPQLFLMRFDADGKLQKTLLNDAPEEKTGGIRGRIKEKKKEEFQEYFEKLAELTKEYMAPSPGTMMDFFTKATYEIQSESLVKANGQSFVQPGDSVSFFVDPSSRNPKQFTFITQFDDAPIDGTVDYGQIPNGPRYTARFKLNVPKKEVTAVIETFDYNKSDEKQ